MSIDHRPSLSNHTTTIHQLLSLNPSAMHEPHIQHASSTFPRIIRQNVMTTHHHHWSPLFIIQYQAASCIHNGHSFFCTIYHLPSYIIFRSRISIFLHNFHRPLAFHHRPATLLTAYLSCHLFRHTSINNIIMHNWASSSVIISQLPVHISPY